MRLALRDWIGIALIFTFCTALTTLFLMPIPASNEQLITYMLGQLSGFVSSVVALHYVASKSDEDKTINTGKAFDAITATAQAASPQQPAPDVILKPGETAQAEEPRP